MKKIGIIFAMDKELDALKKYFSIEKEYTLYNLDFYETSINNLKVILVRSGVGKVNAARTTQVLISLDVDYVFNIGVAGGLSNSLNIGDIVVGEKLVQHDFDITAFDHPKGYIPEIKEQYIYSSKELVNLTKEVLESLNEKVNIGTIASGDIFVTEEKMSNKINTKFNALCVEMEGASIAQVCYLCNIPFLIIRSISDVPNNNNVITYEEFVLESSSKVAKIMYELLKKCSNQ